MRCRCLLKHLYLHIYISALQRQPCLLKTNSTRVLVTWLVTLLLIICPSSYKARLNNLIGTADIEPQINSPQWSNARPNFPTKNFVGGAKFGLVSRLVPPPTLSKCCLRPCSEETENRTEQFKEHRYLLLRTQVLASK